LQEVDASLRLAFRDDGETYDLVHVSDVVDDQYTDDELEERVRTLLMKARGDPPQEQSLYDSGAPRQENPRRGRRFANAPRSRLRERGRGNFRQRP